MEAMEIRVEKDSDPVKVQLIGRLDTNTSGNFETALNNLFDKKHYNIEIDLKDLEYVSSSGLRVFLGAQKKVSTAGGNMVIKNVNDTVMEVFEITGFLDVLTVEKD